MHMLAVVLYFLLAGHQFVNKLYEHGSCKGIQQTGTMQTHSAEAVAIEDKKQAMQG